MKNGSNAGSTLVSHKDIPFLAEYRATVGKTTMSIQQITVINPAASIFFFLKSKISMVYRYSQDHGYMIAAFIYKLCIIHLLFLVSAVDPAYHQH